MVSFICDACGQTVKKNRVEKHYQMECRNCSVLSCIDCGKDFPGNEYVAHTSCVTEAEKYQGKLYQPKEKANKGELKQQEWIKKIQQASGGAQNPKLNSYLDRIQEYSNVPRKKTKFINFCRNSIRVYDQKILDQLWDAFDPSKHKGQNEDLENSKQDFDLTNQETNAALTNSCSNGIIDKEEKKQSKKAKKRKKEEIQDASVDNCIADNETESNSKPKKKGKIENGIAIEEKNGLDVDSEASAGKFSWQKAIKGVLKNAGEDGISLKRLRKKIIAEYCANGSDHRASTQDECSALFSQKLAKYKNAKIVKEHVFYKKCV